MTKTPGRGRYTPWIILAIALAVRLLVAWLAEQPGYTDAYYYAVGARQLAGGQGFVEPFIWNYLDPPPAVIHPGYTYWMPLTAIVGWLGLALGGNTFGALQAPFVLLSALLPLLAYGLARDLAGEELGSPRLQRGYAWLAALLAILPGFYSHVLVLPDNFAPFALAGSLCLWAAGRGLRDGRPAWFALAGLAAGLGHLARADGLLLVAVALLAALAGGLSWRRASSPAETSRGRSLLAVGLVLLGYLAIMAPWFARNWTLFGTLLPGAGTRTLFLTTYDDIFAYGRPLSLEQYLAWGWDAILKSKLQALALNLQRLWVENLLIVLLPFSALGLWRLRHNRLLWPFFLYLPLLFAAMTLAFTFPGMRGGLWHSGGALLPFFFAAAGPGLETVLRWAARRLRGWYVHRAWPVFAGGLVGLALLLTLFALWQAGLFDGTWNRRNEGYQQIGQWLADNERGQATVMVGDPPAFAWHTGHPAIAIPNEPLETILAVAGRYNTAYLVLDHTRPRTTDDLYTGEAHHPRLRLIHEIGEWQVYEIQDTLQTSGLAPPRGIGHGLAWRPCHNRETRRPIGSSQARRSDSTPQTGYSITQLYDNGKGGRMFNTYNWGGHLIWRLYPDKPVSVDGRTDLYALNSQVLEDYVTVHWLRPGWQQVLDQYDIGFAITGQRGLLELALAEAQDWDQVYSDEVAVIYVRVEGVT